ncbi:MAG: hypothetical protein Q4D99_00030 [Bacillota bacterium]|nr:hypothetical protein [Bacillota bacterium]
MGIKDKVDVSAIKEKALSAGEIIADKAEDLKESAIDIKEDINEKLTELDNMLKETVNEYNDTFTLMNDKGVRLFVERTRAVDTIELSKNLVNSIANHPKEFDQEFETIDNDRKKFSDSAEFAERELEAAREAAGSAGAGVAAGASVAFMAPTAAMWIATTFGTASTGAAISTLSGAAATNAALAWIGGGTLASGGGGVVAGQALIALSGPIGWSIAGATLLTTIIVFAAKRTKLNKEKNEEIEAVKNNIEIVKEMDVKIKALLEQTMSIRDGLNEACISCMNMFGRDYADFDDKQKESLAALVNNTKALSATLNNVIE